MEIEFKNVDFVLNQKGKVKLDYRQLNDGNEPNRIAVMKTKVNFLPFEGYDRYFDGIASMEGRLLKIFKMFNVKNEDLNSGSLVTYLSESLLNPKSLFSGYITFKEIDKNNVEAIIKYKGITQSGIFTISDIGEMEEFRTETRYNVDFKGNKELIPWVAKVSNYKVGPDGILRPTKMQAIWKYKNHDLKYFDASYINFILK